MYTNQAVTHSTLLSSLEGGLPASQLKSEPVREISVPKPSTKPERHKETGSNETDDRVTLSPQGRHKAASLSQETDDTQNEQQGPTPNLNREDAQQVSNLKPEEQRAVEQLKQRDMEVRSHEQAHLANAGQYAAGSAQYSYQKGPDGRRYAVGGEVPIDISKESTPEATIQKMQTVRKAALAPASPSSADRQIAAAATQKEAQARQEIQRTSTDESAAESTREPDFSIEAQPSENNTGAPSSPRQSFTAVA